MDKVWTHAELVEIGYKWVMSRCSFAFKELVTVNSTGEIPDVIGWSYGGTFVLEAKTSRADYLADRRKKFRFQPALGMGDWRFYIAPAGIIKVSELSPSWGLIEINEKGKPKLVRNPFTDRPMGNIYSNWHRNLKNEDAELDMLRSALRRLQEKGVMELIYEK